MNIQLLRQSISAILLSIILPATAMSQGNGQIGQVLETAIGSNDTVARELDFANPTSTTFAFTNKPLANFTDCALSSGTGLWCVNKGTEVINIPALDPTNQMLPPPEFSCFDPALGLSTKSEAPCLTIAVTAKGALYLSGIQNKGGKTAYKVMKLEQAVEENAVLTCITADGFANLQFSPNWCVKTLALGRPLVTASIAVIARNHFDSA